MKPLLSTVLWMSATSMALADGFTVKAPPGWKVEQNNGRILVSSGTGEFVAIEAIANPRGLKPAQLLQSLAQTGAVGLLKRPVLALARDTDSRLAAAQLSTADLRARVLLAAGGSVATLMTAAAPSAVFAKRLPQLIEVLQSFRFTPASGSKPPSIAFQRVADVREQAFSTEMPVGWQNEAGTYRPTVGDYRHEARTQSPDGKIAVFQGDRNIGRFLTPTPQMAQFGVREGGTYNPSGATVFSVLRYLPGAEFAKYYVGRRFPGARMSSAQNLPQMTAKTAELRYRNGNPNRARVDCGEVEFEYQGKQGYVVVTTEMSGGMMGASFWNVISLTGYLSPAESTGTAAMVAQQMVNSNRANSQWVMREYRMQAIEAKQGMDALHAIQDVWAKTLQERSESNARHSRLVGDNLAGQYRMQDPTTGQQVNVQAQSNYFYRVNGTDQVVGTNHELGDNTPIDVTRLLRLDVDIKP